MSVITIGEGDVALHLDLGADGGVRFIRLWDSPDEGLSSEIWIRLDQVDQLVRALQTLQALGK